MNRPFRRVVVTGLGMVSPLGISVESSWKNLISGVSGIVDIKDLPQFNKDSFPECYIAPIHASFDRNKWKVAVRLITKAYFAHKDLYLVYS